MSKSTRLLSTANSFYPLETGHRDLAFPVVSFLGIRVRIMVLGLVVSARGLIRAALARSAAIGIAAPVAGTIAFITDKMLLGVSRRARSVKLLRHYVLSYLERLGAIGPRLPSHTGLILPRAIRATTEIIDVVVHLPFCTARLDSIRRLLLIRFASWHVFAGRFRRFGAWLALWGNIDWLGYIVDLHDVDPR